MTAVSLARPPPAALATPLDAHAVHAAHAGFLWATLQRLGGHPSDLDDLYQEVLLVVHRRRQDYDPASPLRPWLFGICLRVVAAWRRRAHRRYETLTDTAPEQPARTPSPEDEAERTRARAVLHAVLDTLDLERRAIFVMYELDELPCEEIAAIVGVPVGTVHSRLFAARKDFQRAAARWQARHPRVTLP
jgi:RNA polymerase sigma-70 factor (ECF subfamily)